MAHGWQTTWDVLATSRNDAAVSVLATAIDRAPEPIARRAMEILLERRSPLGYWEFLLRWERLEPAWRDRLAGHGVRFANAVRDALLSQDERIWRIGCEAVLWIGEYDLISVLLLAVEEREGWVAEMAADTVIALCQKLLEETADPSDPDAARRQARLKTHSLEALAHATDQFDRHRNRRIVEAFLLLADAHHPVLLEVIGNPHHPAFLVVLDLLKHSTRAPIVDLAFAWLRSGNAPISVLKVIAHRNDVAFLKRLFSAVGPNPVSTVTSAFRRLESLSWAAVPIASLEQLTELQQTALVRLVVASGMPRTAAFETVQDVLLRGRTGARRAASELLGQFGGAAANALVIRGLDDPDPVVRANLYRQLRSRSIPGCITRLVRALESEHDEVREAARDSLEEFTFRKFITVIDLLDDDVKVSMGRLVRRVDPRGIDELRKELKSPARTRRLRAIDVAMAMGAVEEVEVTLIDRLSSEEDHLVRASIVRALGQSGSSIAEAAVRQALSDRHPTVREEAQLALAVPDESNAEESLGRLTALVQEASALFRGRPAAAAETVPGAGPSTAATSSGESQS